MTTSQIEIAVARFFGTRANLIVPNVCWGFNIHECDLLIISKSGYATEVEIKISLYDIVNDKKKKHGHQSNKIKKLFFAIPKNLENCIHLIPDRAGVIIVNENLSCEIIREAQVNIRTEKLTAVERYHIAELAVMRYWNLKEKIKELI